METRGVGTHRTTLRGRTFERYTSASTLWMLQRSLDAYRPRHRLGKRRFQLVFES